MSCALWLAAAWVAAGSAGLMAHPLRRILTALLLLAGVLSGFRWRAPARRDLPGVLAGAAAVAACLASPIQVLQVLACALTAGWLAARRPPESGAPARSAAQALLVFALYQFATTLIPFGWQVADGVAGAVSRLVSLVSPWPLSVGATFAGLDYLALSLVFCLLLVRSSPSPRKTGLAFQWAGGVLAAHAAYLILLASFPQWRQWLPDMIIPSSFPGLPGKPKPMGDVILWQLPALGLLCHLPVVIFAARRLGGAAPAGSPSVSTAARTPSGGRRAVAEAAAPPRWRARLRNLAAPMTLAAAGLAAAVPGLTMLRATPLSLQGRKIVVYEKGFLNWLKPQHGEYGRLTVGMYGIWPEFLERYGAHCRISPDLSAADLEGADLLVLIFPNKPWEPGQLERIQSFVAGGGSLLLLGEHTVVEKDGGNRFNDVLAPTAARVAFDSAMFAVGGWLQSYQATAHPAALGLRDDRNQFGVVIGASVETRWPARPLLIGRWGWNDPGDVKNDETRGGSMMGNSKYDAGERLGDVVLAAEQTWGRGQVTVFGDTSGFTNGILQGSHPFVAALLASLCQRASFSAWRFAAGLAALAALGWLVTRQQRLLPALVAGLTLAAATAAASAWTARMARLLPEGRGPGPNYLAYLDTTHLERASAESWRPGGLGALQLTLMRNGYLVLGLPEFSEDRLERAGLVVSAAPGRPFTASERARVRRYVENGGVFILTAGWPESLASRSLLADFGFAVGGRGAAEGSGPEPKPFGHFKAPYFNGGDYMAHVRFHAAWPVEATEPGAQPLAYGPRHPLTGADPCVIQMRRRGRGKFIIVADSEFASCQNLENEGGQPFEGLRENADFWRWLVTYINDQPAWVPPKPPPQTNSLPAPPES